MKAALKRRIAALALALTVAGSTAVSALPTDSQEPVPAQPDSPISTYEPDVPVTSAPPSDGSSETPDSPVTSSVPEEQPESSEPVLPESQPQEPESQPEEETSSETESQSSQEESASSQSPASSLPVEFGNDMWNEDLAVTLSLACDWVNSEQGSLCFLCMGAAGKSAVSRNLNQYIVDVSLKQNYEDILQLSYDILNVTFSGYNARNVLGKDLLNILASYPDYGTKNLHAVAYALLAIDSNPYEIQNTMKNSRPNLKTLLLSFQNPDGGFFSFRSEESSVIQTGLALTALSPYREEEAVAQAISRGVEYLASQQQSDGFFLDDQGEPSSIAISKVIVALNSLGLSVRDQRFVKDGRNLLQILQDYVNTDSGFAEYLEESSNTLATENAILAMVSVKKKGSPYVMDTPLKTTGNKSEENVVIEEQDTLDWISNSLYILLIVLGVVLVLAIVLVKLHPFRRSRHYAEHTDDPEEEDLQKPEDKSPPTA